jgi:hypothetical protein
MLRGLLKRLFPVRFIVICNGRNVEVVYSEQATKLMKQLKDFNKDDFEKQYFDKIVVGDRAILEYIFNRGAK